MKPVLVQALNRMSMGIAAQQKATITTTTQSPQVTPKVGNRHQRRKQETFNRLLAKRLKKDGTGVTVKTLPDGGLHIDVNDKELVRGEELKKRLAEMGVVEDPPAEAPGTFFQGDDNQPHGTPHQHAVSNDAPR